MWNPVLTKSLHHRILRGSTEAAMKIALRIMLACACALPFQGSCQTTEHNAAIYRYRGADREQRMLEQARSEGTVVVYTSLAPSESKPLAQAFENKTGVKVELWRAISEKLVQRALTEARARHYAFDVIETNGPEMEMMAREKLFAEFHSPHLADPPPGAAPARGARVRRFRSLAGGPGAAQLDGPRARKHQGADPHEQVQLHRG